MKSKGRDLVDALRYIMQSHGERSDELDEKCCATIANRVNRIINGVENIDALLEKLTKNVADVVRSTRIVETSSNHWFDLDTTAEYVYDEEEEVIFIYKPGVGQDVNFNEITGSNAVALAKYLSLNSIRSDE